MKKYVIRKILVMILSIIMLISLIGIQVRAETKSNTTNIKTFSDMQGHWAAKAVNQWQYYNIIEGIGNNKFNPDGKVLRRDFAVILDRLFKYNDLAINPFEDLELDQYYTIPILKLTAGGIIDGTLKYVRPHVNITREEAVVMICKAFKIDPIPSNTTFLDDSEISNTARPYIAAAQKEKVVSGSYGYFHPKSGLSRAEAITIINNMITAYYNKSGTYKNTLVGSGFIADKRVTINSSSISGNLYVSSGAYSGTVSMNNTTIKGKIVNIADSSSLVLTGTTKIDTIDVRADSTKIVNADLAKSVIINEEANETTITGVPEKLTMYPNTVITIDKVEVSNAGTEIAVFKKVEVQNMVANKTGYVTDGPKVSMKNVAVDMDNYTIGTGINISNYEDSDIVEVGVIYNKDNNIPILNKEDARVKYNANYLGYEIDMAVGVQDPATAWTYRAYAIDRQGKIGYSKAFTTKSFQYKITGNVMDTKSITDKDGNITSIEKRVQIYIYGSNIPKISKVSVLSDMSSNANNTYTETKAILEASNTGSTIMKQSYIATIKYKPEKDGGFALDNYFGYRIEFASGVGTKENFPAFTNSTKLTDDIVSIKTGDAVFTDSDTILIQNNEFVEGTGLVLETGIVLLESYSGSSTPSTVTSSWKKQIAYSGAGVMRPTYDVTIDVNTDYDRTYYYAAYVRTSTKTSYGTIKSISTPKIPVYQGIKSMIVSKDKTSVTVAFNVQSSIPLNLSYSKGIQRFKDSSNKTVDKYEGKTLLVAGATFSNNTLTMTFNGLEPNADYSITLALSNGRGTTNTGHIVISTK